VTMTTDRAAPARQLWRLLEPIHAVTYFSPEPLDRLKSVGYRGFWMGYFAARAAPLGAASAELVHALFYNFSFDHVARALPDAWRFASPSAAIDARQAGSADALRRHLGAEAESPAVQRAADLAIRAARSAPLEGRPLFAANRALPEPEEPLSRLWHAATMLREHRGDGHVAALVAAGIGGRDAHVLHALSAGIPAPVYVAARNLDEQEWAAVMARLADRGLADPGGGLTDAGLQTKQHIEDQTDARAAAAYTALDDGEVEELIAVLRPVSAAVVTAGEIPTKSPMGLDLDESGL